LIVSELERNLIFDSSNNIKPLFNELEWSIITKRKKYVLRSAVIFMFTAMISGTSDTQLKKHGILEREVK
jgi:hypothetical protein